MKKKNKLIFKKLSEFKDGDVVIPKEYVYGDKYEYDILYAGHAASFLVVNNMNEMGNCIRPMAVSEFDFVEKVNYGGNKPDFDFVKIGECYSNPFRFKTDFYIFNRNKYKHYLDISLIAARIFSRLMVNCNFPFIHVRTA